MVGGVVLREGVAVVGAEGLVGARQLGQRGLEGLQVLRAELRQGGERVVDAQERGGVVGDLEVRGALRDELGSCQCTILYNAILYCDVLCCALGCCAVLFGTALRCGEGACGVWWTYSSGVFVEKHVGGGKKSLIIFLVGDGRGFVFGNLFGKCRLVSPGVMQPSSWCCSWGSVCCCGGRASMAHGNATVWRRCWVAGWTAAAAAQCRHPWAINQHRQSTRRVRCVPVRHRRFSRDSPNCAFYSPYKSVP